MYILSKENMNLLKMIKSYVAYFDLLGFKRAVLCNTQEACNCLEALRVAVEDKNKIVILPPNTLKPTFGADRLKYFFFADSILLYTISDNQEDLLAAIGFAGYLMANAMYLRLPIRGGISHGDFYVNERYNLFCGVPAVKAFQLSENSQWMGLVLDDFVAQNYINSSQNVTATRQPEAIIQWDLSLKKGASRKSWVSTWPLILERRNNNTVTPELFFENYKSMFKCEYDDLSDDVKLKYANTCKFINYVYENYPSAIKF